MDFEKIFGDIEINEEQSAALKEFIDTYAESKVNKAKKDIELFNESMLNGYIKKEDAEKAFELFRKDTEKAFELYSEDTEKAFELFQKDAERAFELYSEDNSKEFKTKFVEALSEIYEDVEQKAKEEFLESTEYGAFKKIKNILAPYTENGVSDEKTLSKLEALEEEVKELRKEKVINTLISDLPSEISENVKVFIESAETEEEIYQRYKLFLEMAEKASVKVKKENKKQEKTVINEDVNDDLVIIDEEEEIDNFLNKKQKVSSKSKSASGNRSALLEILHNNAEKIF